MATKKPDSKLSIDVERDGFDENMDFATATRVRRSIPEYLVFDLPINLLRFSYVRSKIAADRRLCALYGQRCLHCLLPCFLGHWIH